MSDGDLFLGYIPKNFNDDGKTTCLMVGAMVVAELFFTVLVIVTAPKGVKDRLYYSSCILCIPKVMAMFYFAWHGTAASFGTLEGRTFGGREFNTEFFCTIYIAHSIFGILNEATKDGMNLHTLPMFIHHMASIVSFGVAMHTGHFIVYTAYCGLCEITNIPLSIMYLSKTKGGGVAAWMEKNFGILLSVNGGMLWLTFFVFRVIMFPYILFTLFKDYYTISQNDPRYSEVWATELYYHPCTVMFLWVISMMWFQKIHAGFMKVLTGESTAANAAPEKAE